MLISGKSLRSIIRRQLRAVNEQLSTPVDPNVKKAQDTGSFSFGVEDDQSQTSKEKTTTMGFRESEALDKDNNLAALAAAIEMMKKVASGGDDNQIASCAYAIIEIYDKIEKGDFQGGKSELSDDFINFGIPVRAQDPATFDELKNRGAAVKIDTTKAMFDKMGGGDAAKKADEGEKMREEGKTGKEGGGEKEGEAGGGNDTTTGKPAEVTSVGGNSFQISDPDALIHFQEWLMTQPANKGKKRAEIVGDDAKYGPKTHAAAVATLPDNLGGVDLKKFKKLDWGTIKANKKGEMGDIALLLMLKKMPWNSEKYAGQTITKGNVETQSKVPEKGSGTAPTIKSKSVGEAGPVPMFSKK